MTKQISWGFTDTPISGVSELKFDRGMLNFGADFRVKTQASSEAVLTNTTSPLDRPEKVRFARTEVKDIYANTDIDPSVYAPSRKGLSIVAQVTEVLSVTDTNDAEYRVDLPVSAHLVLRTPANEHITPEIVFDVIGRLVSTLYDTGSSEASRLNALLRGSLLPTDI